MFHINKLGVDYYSGPRFAGSPYQRFYRRNTQRTIPVGGGLPYMIDLPRANFCWLPSGAPCQSWSGFQFEQRVN